MFGRKQKKDKLKEAEQMSERNRKDIERIETKELALVKRRQIEIQQRLAMLKQELDVQQRGSK